jgi:hypothetical protein
VQQAQRTTNPDGRVEKGSQKHEKYGLRAKKIKNSGHLSFPLKNGGGLSETRKIENRI